MSPCVVGVPIFVTLVIILCHVMLNNTFLRARMKTAFVNLEVSNSMQRSIRFLVIVSVQLIHVYFWSKRAQVKLNK